MHVVECRPALGGMDEAVRCHDSGHGRSTDVPQQELAELETQISEIQSNEDKLRKQHIQLIELKEILTQSAMFYQEAWLCNAQQP